MPTYRLFLLIRAVSSFCGAAASTLYIAYQVESVGLNPLQLVLVGTALEVVCFLAQVPTGIIADAKSRKLSVVIGYLLMGAGMLLTGLVPTFLAMLAGSAVWGIGCCCVDGAEEAWLTDELGPTAAAPAFTGGTQVGLAGGILGIGAAVALGSASLGLPLVLGGAGWLLLGAVLHLVMVETDFVPAARTPIRSPRHVLRRAGDLSRLITGRPVLVMVIGAMVFLGLGSEGYDRFGQAHFLTDLHLPGLLTPVVWFGLIGLSGMLLAIVGTEVVRRRVRHSDTRHVTAALVVVTALTVVGIVWFGLTGSFWWAVAATSLVTIARTATGPLFTANIALNSDSANRATVFSIAGQADALGQIAGGPGVGYVGQRAGIPTALVSTGLLMAPAVALLGVALIRRAPRAKGAQSLSINRSAM